MSSEPPFEEMIAPMKRAAAALRDAGIPFLLAGGIASFVYGGPPSDHDVDFVLKPADADRALAELEQAGFRPEKPPEPWLYKAWAEDVLIDLIFQPAGLEITDEVIDRGEEREVFAMPMRLMRPEDILATKINAMTEHTLNFESCLEIARALREQIRWADLRDRTLESPFSKAFFMIVEELGIAQDTLPENGREATRR